MIFILYLFLILVLLVIIIRNLFSIYRKLKKNNFTSVNDNFFEVNDWNNYIFFYFKFKECKNKKFDDFMKVSIDNTRKWEKNMKWYKNYDISGIIEINNDNIKSKKLIKMIEKTQPPNINNHILPFKIIYLTKHKEAIFLFNHYYIDGINNEIFIYI